MTSSLPMLFLFSSTLMMGTLVSLSSNNLFMVWLGLELNLMSFIPMVMMSQANQESEAIIKYFLPQALGSGLLLMSGVSSMVNNSMIYFASLIIIVSISMKAGLAPIHFWFPSVMASLSWSMCIILSSWQKIAPLLIMFKMSSYMNLNFCLIIALMSAIIGGIGGLNQTGLRPIMAYSSINHMGWMFASSQYSLQISHFYFMLYILMIITLMMMFNFMHMFSLNQLITEYNNSSFSMKMMMSLLILSLAGVPPLIGFIPKWMVIQLLVSYQSIISIIILVIGSLISLYFYLTLMFNMVLTRPSSPNMNTSTNINSIFPMMICSIITAPMMIM